MSRRRDSEDEGSGFETSAELRRQEAERQQREEEMAGPPPRRRLWGRWVGVFVALVVIGLVIYVVVSVV